MRVRRFIEKQLMLPPITGGGAASLSGAPAPHHRPAAAPAPLDVRPVKGRATHRNRREENGAHLTLKRGMIWRTRGLQRFQPHAFRDDSRDMRTTLFMEEHTCLHIIQAVNGLSRSYSR